MAISITPLAGSPSRAGLAWPLLVEAALVAAAIAALLPLFDRLAAQDAGRDRRYAQTVLAVRGLPDPVVPALCASHGTLAEPLVRNRLCPGIAGNGGAPRADRIPLVVASANSHAKQAFAVPLAQARARLAELRLQQREGLGDLRALGHAIEAVEADIDPFLRRYAIEPRDATGPLPLACAYARVASALSSAGTRSGNAHDIARANALMLLGAALDGHAAVPALAAAAMLPAPSAVSDRRCAEADTAHALAEAAVLMAAARATPNAADKNEAMRALLRSAGWQWAGWSIAGLALLHLSRFPGVVPVGIALSLATWAAAAWIGRVPWPFASDRSLVLGRESASAVAAPADFVLALLGAAVAMLVLSPLLRRALASRAQRIASAFGYPGLVFATGVGWLLLLDLSANAHFGNRYLALYHQGHLWLGMLTFSVVAFARQPFGRALGWTLSVAEGVATAVGKRLGAVPAAALLVASTVALVAVVGTLLLNVRQLTSEIGRLWLIVGAAWFFFLRGTPLAERLVARGGSAGSLLRYVWPMLFVVTVLIGAMLITRDMGPLLIAGYGAGAFVAASIAMWHYQRLGTPLGAYAVAIALFVAWIVAATFALLRLGAIDEVTAGRLENLAAPLASANDQLALVTWFQRAAPERGFGLGDVPWCGFGTVAACAGVPAQIQSDYTFTAIVGAFGRSAAWALVLGCALWLHGLIRPHAQATRGEPRLVRVAGRMRSDEQAFVSWVCVAWVVLALCQLSVTVAGNLAVIPLTGVTFPFVSFGMTSLVANMAMLALALTVNDDRHG